MPPQGPVRGVFSYLDYPGILSLPGIEQLRRFRHRELPYGPIWYLTGLEMAEFDEGTSTFRLPATGWWRSAAGVMTGGALAFAADGALAGAICSTLDPGCVLATSDLALNFVHPPAADCGGIIARAKVIDVGRAQGLSEAIVEDTDGRLLAHATSRCVIMRLPGPMPDPPAMPVPPPE